MCSKILIRVIFGLVPILMLMGCKSRPLGPYVSPALTGQLLAADTGKPLAGVTVVRGQPEPRRMSPPKGGEVLLHKVPPQTDSEGRFELASERVLSVFRGTGWNMVSLSFERSGYQHFQTNCPVSAATNTANGEPLLNIGRIWLQPIRK